MTVANAVLKLTDVSKSYGANKAIEAVSLTVQAGEFVALLGPSGAGKSTIFRCVSQLTRPDVGDVFLNAKRLNDLHGQALRLERRRIGLIFQQFNLVSRLNALQNVLLGRLGHMPGWRATLGLFSQADRQLALRALDRVGLLHKAYQRADTLSGGQQQRVAIARVLTQKSDLILADEPVASLDPTTSRQVLSNLRAVALENKMAILCSLHQVDLALEFADRVVAVSNGQISLNKSADQVSVRELEGIYADKPDPVVLEPLSPIVLESKASFA